MPELAVLNGILRGLLLFDIAESIDLDQLRSIIGTVASRREPAFRHPAPEYVRFEHPPVNQPFGERSVLDASDVEVRIRYFDYGVASVEFQLPFAADWPELIRLANKWILSPSVESAAAAILKEALALTAPALRKPYQAWVSEDYYVVQVDQIRETGGEVMSADTLLADCGPQIAQIVRGERWPLSATESQEVLQSRMSYYPGDLLVLGWVGAFVYDTRESAGPTVEILEYANTQLLEYRYYDDALNDALAAMYKVLDQRHTMWARWKLSREAQSLNTLRLDYEELVERTDNAIKFLSDMFYARVYRLAAARIGVTDYRHLVSEKLNTARDLYQSMVNEFHQGRTFFLEVMVVVILIVEIVLVLVHKM